MANMKTLLDDSDQHVDGDSNPQLCLHRVKRSAVECFDAEVLLDPFEEKFDLPTTFIQLRYDQRIEIEIIGQKCEVDVMLGGIVTDTAQLNRIVYLAIDARQYDCLIRTQTGTAVNRARVHAPELRIYPIANNEKRGSRGDMEQAHKIDVATVHNVESVWFQKQSVKQAPVRSIPVGDFNKSRNRAAQIETGMQFDSSMTSMNSCPRKNRKAEIDNGRIKGVHRAVHFNTKFIAGIQSTRLMNQDLREVGIDTPITVFIGVGESITGNIAADTHVVKFMVLRPEACFDVAETLAVCELRESQTAKLITAGKVNNFVIATIPLDTFTKFVGGQKVHQLCEDGFSGMHWPPFPGEWDGYSTEMISNRKIVIPVVS